MGNGAQTHSPRYLMIRPRKRMVVVQLLVGLLLMGGMAAIAGGRAPAIACAFGAGWIVWVVAHIIWFRRNAPRAIVVTNDFIGIITRAGDESRVPWSSICSAVHSTKMLGMQWELDLIPSGGLNLRDIGISSGRWGILRATVIELVGSHGASILTDPLSEGMYDKG